jgi:hypothetical protein
VPGPAAVGKSCAEAADKIDIVIVVKKIGIQRIANVRANFMRAIFLGSAGCQPAVGGSLPATDCGGATH